MMDCLLLFLILEVKVRDCYRSPIDNNPGMDNVERLYLCPVNLIRSMVEGFVRPVQGVSGYIFGKMSMTSLPTICT